MSEARPIKILALGTSLTQGYNLPPGTDFCAVLQSKLRSRGHDVTIVNAGVSGDTSAGGLARLAWALDDSIEGAMVELGANDALRGLDVAATKRNLDAILSTLQKKGLAIMLSGMKAPRNLGTDYIRPFDALYPELAKKYRVLFYPFFLEGIAANLSLNQADGIHPNEKGTQVIVNAILPTVEKLITEIKKKRAVTTN